MTSPIDMCTVAQMHAYLNIPTGVTAADALLQQLITAASQFFIDYCNRNFLSQTYLENRDGVGGGGGSQEFITLGFPIQTVQEVTICGSSIPAATGWPRSGYFFGAWYVGVDGYYIPRGRKIIQLQYTAGFAAYPNDLVQACIELVALKYKQKDRIGISGAASIDGQSAAFKDMDMSAAVRTTANLYRRVTPIIQ